jgi:transposase-like protein
VVAAASRVVARIDLDHDHEYPSQWKAICSIADKSDLNRGPRRQWVRQRERDAGRRPGLTITDERKHRWGIELICRQLRIAPSTYHAAKKRPPPKRALRDEQLKLEILRVGSELPRLRCRQDLSPAQPRGRQGSPAAPSSD